MRAFLNGRLDLAQAESVAQLISARTSVAAETALAGMQVSTVVGDGYENIWRLEMNGYVRKFWSSCNGSLGVILSYI